jgi:ABC-type bacteriocin/lantibiotic exporter with double-glycine peptidase domain
VLALSSRSAADLTGAIWDRLVHLPPSFFRGVASGRLAQEAGAVDQMRALISSSLVAALSGSALAVGAIALLFAYSLTIALVVTLALAVTVAFGAAFLRREAAWLETTIEDRNRLNGLLLGLFSGISKLRVAGAELRAHALWQRGYAFQQEAQRNASLQALRATVLQGLLPGLFLLAVIVAIEVFEGGDTSLVDFSATVAAAGQLAAAAGSMLIVGSGLIQIRPLYRSARPIMEATPEVSEAAALPGEVRGEIQLDSVTFGYVEDSVVLDGVSLRAEPGSFLAIVGPSGSGKTTIMRLILGFETPWSGGVLLDGKDLGRLDVESVRRSMGTVIQGARIMAGTILDNIVGARPLGVDDAWEAAELAGVADDIRAMPMRMSTVVPEGGSGFSGGQLQRLLLARALVRNPKVLLLDEATSALDNKVQELVAENLAKAGVTRIVVAHRLSTIRRADRIVVLERGRIVEEGPFADLMAANGLFASLARRQLL